MSDLFAAKTCNAHDGTKLYYRDYAGPTGAPHTVICLPGLMRNSKDFEEVAAHLSQRYRVLACDLRGRGNSGYADDPMTYQPPIYVRDVKAVLDDAGVKSAVFLGTSLGGLVTMISASLMREKVKAVIINDIGPTMEPEALAGIEANLGVGEPVKTWDEAAAITKDRNGHALPNFSDEQWLEMATRLWRQDGDTIRLDYDFRAKLPFERAGPVGDVDLWPLFRAFEGLPAMAIRGKISTLLSEETFSRMKDELPALEQVWADGVGHAPYLNEPDVRPAIDAFLEKVPPRLGPFSRMAKKIRSVILRWSMIAKYAKHASSQNAKA